MERPMKNLFIAAAIVAASAAQAQPAPVAVASPWARVVLQGQSNSAAYMTLTAREPLTLTGASTPAAGIVEVHEMWMDGDVMKMRARESVPLRPGEPLAFRPGGYHFMLMGLKAAFRPGTVVPMTLQFRDAQGNARELQVQVPVAHAAPSAHKD
jgi:periplasmic copper chaperone A